MSTLVGPLQPPSESACLENLLLEADKSIETKQKGRATSRTQDTEIAVSYPSQFRKSHLHVNFNERQLRKDLLAVLKNLD